MEKTISQNKNNKASTGKAFVVKTLTGYKPLVFSQVYASMK